MLLLYQMRALAHSSLNRITDETWAMDGFVSKHKNLKQLANDLLKLTKSRDCLYFICLFIVHLPDKKNITGNGTVTAGAKNKPPLDRINPVFPHY